MARVRAHGERLLLAVSKCGVRLYIPQDSSKGVVRACGSGVDVPADDPLHRGAGEHDDGVGELEREAVGQLVVEARLGKAFMWSLSSLWKAKARHGGQWEAHELIDVTLLGVEVLHAHALGEIRADVGHHAVHEPHENE